MKRTYLVTTFVCRFAMSLYMALIVVTVQAGPLVSLVLLAIGALVDSVRTKVAPDLVLPPERQVEINRDYYIAVDTKGRPPAYRSHRLTIAILVLAAAYWFALFHVAESSGLSALSSLLEWTRPANELGSFLSTTRALYRDHGGDTGHASFVAFFEHVYLTQFIVLTLVVIAGTTSDYVGNLNIDRYDALRTGKIKQRYRGVTLGPGMIRFGFYFMLVGSVALILLWQSGSEGYLYQRATLLDGDKILMKWRRRWDFPTRDGVVLFAGGTLWFLYQVLVLTRLWSYREMGRDKTTAAES